MHFQRSEGFGSKIRCILQFPSCFYTQESLVALEQKEIEEQRIEDQKSQKSGQEASETVGRLKKRCAIDIIQSNGWNIFAMVAFGFILLAILIAAIWLIMKGISATRSMPKLHVREYCFPLQKVKSITLK